MSFRQITINNYIKSQRHQNEIEQLHRRRVSTHQTHSTALADPYKFIIFTGRTHTHTHTLSYTDAPLVTARQTRSSGHGNWNDTDRTLDLNQQTTRVVVCVFPRYPRRDGPTLHYHIVLITIRFVIDRRSTRTQRHGRGCRVLAVAGEGSATPYSVDATRTNEMSRPRPPVDALGVGSANAPWTFFFIY